MAHQRIALTSLPLPFLPLTSCSPPEGVHLANCLPVLSCLFMDGVHRLMIHNSRSFGGGSRGNHWCFKLLEKQPVNTQAPNLAFSRAFSPFQCTEVQSALVPPYPTLRELQRLEAPARASMQLVENWSMRVPPECAQLFRPALGCV